MRPSILIGRSARAWDLRAPRDGPLGRALHFPWTLHDLRHTSIPRSPALSPSRATPNRPPSRRRCWRAAANDRDLLVSAQTGSGKTVAYGLALAPTLLGEAERLGRAERAAGAGRRADPRTRPPGRPRAGLALRAGRRRRGHLRRRHGLPARAAGPARGRATSWSAPPGACATTSSAAISISARSTAVVLDEADEMLDLGFKEDLEFILEATPPERRTLLFSATLPKDIVALARTYQKNADAHRHRPRRRGARRHRVPRHARGPQRDRARGRQRPALLRSRRAPWCSAPPARPCATCTPPCASAASTPSPSPAR